MRVRCVPGQNAHAPLTPNRISRTAWSWHDGATDENENGDTTEDEDDFANLLPQRSAVTYFFVFPLRCPEKMIAFW